MSSHQACPCPAARWLASIASSDAGGGKSAKGQQNTTLRNKQIQRSYGDSTYILLTLELYNPNLCQCYEYKTSPRRSRKKNKWQKLFSGRDEKYLYVNVPQQIGDAKRDLCCSTAPPTVRGSTACFHRLKCALRGARLLWMILPGSSVTQQMLLDTWSNQTSCVTVVPLTCDASSFLAELRKRRSSPSVPARRCVQGEKSVIVFVEKKKSGGDIFDNATK